MIFLRPNDLLQPRLPDQAFAAEAAACRAAGYPTLLFDQLEFEQGATPRWPDLGGQTVVYRGWMLEPAAYARLMHAVSACGGVPLTSSAAYTQAHYLPEWYPLLHDLTPRTVVLDPADDPVAALRELNWPSYFIKDYVKSLKTARGAIIHDPAELPKLLAEMQAFRGSIEGGICVREVEPLVAASERRFFVLRGRVHSAETSIAVPEIVVQAAQRIPGPFFSIDCSWLEDGVARIVEIGDGQVSDLVGWTPERFAEIWQE